MAGNKVKLSPADCDLLERGKIERFSGPSRRHFEAGTAVSVARNLRAEAYSRQPGAGKTLMTMGAFSYCVSNAAKVGSLKVGRFCSIAREVDVFDGQHPVYTASSSPFSYSEYFRSTIGEDVAFLGPENAHRGSYGRIVVGNDVWIGVGAKIKAGVTIGHGAVVAAWSVVVKDVPPYAIVGGNPAKVIKYRFPQEVIDRFCAVRWWDLPIDFVRRQDFRDPVAFLDACEAERATSPEDQTYSVVTLGRKGLTLA